MTFVTSSCLCVLGHVVPVRTVTSGNVPSDMLPIKDSYHHTLPRSLIRIFTGRILDNQECKVSECEQRRLGLDCWINWAHMSGGTISHVAVRLTECGREMPA